MMAPDEKSLAISPDSTLIRADQRARLTDKEKAGILGENARQFIRFEHVPMVPTIQTVRFGF
jgi:hypothetical protein